mgnify:CR=1 FL=1
MSAKGKSAMIRKERMSLVRMVWISTFLTSLDQNLSRPLMMDTSLLYEPWLMDFQKTINVGIIGMLQPGLHKIGWGITIANVVNQ